MVPPQWTDAGFRLSVRPFEKSADKGNRLPTVHTADEREGLGATIFTGVMQPVLETQVLNNLDFLFFWGFFFVF